MRQIQLFILFAILGTALLSAQSRTERVLSEFDASKGLTIEFEMTTPDYDKPLHGTYQAQGTKFFIETSLFAAWYNGSDLWIYLFQNQEVNLSTPTSVELADINPLINISALFSGKIFRIKSEEKSGGELQIMAYPKTSQYAHIKSIRLLANRLNKPYKLIVREKESHTGEVSVKIKSLRRGVQHPSTLFSFNRKLYPNVEIIDLR